MDFSLNYYQHNKKVILMYAPTHIQYIILFNFIRRKVVPGDGLEPSHSKSEGF